VYPRTVAGRASIVGAAETHVGKVRNHNEDSHFIDPEQGIFLVCDGMGGHAAGEVASALAVETIRDRWANPATTAIAERWLASGAPEAHHELLAVLRDGALAAHDAILAEAKRDRTKGGMGTTLVGAMVVGGDMLFAQCGDSRAYLVRDGIAMQLTEDHTLLARLLAAGVDVDVDGDGARFKSMLTNALGIGEECKVSSFVVPVADGDRFLLCSDGITEYVKEPEIGEVLCKQPSPARAAQRLVELALERGGGDNATALVVRVLEAGETSRPAELLRKDAQAIEACPLWAKVTPQQRLRALRIGLPRDHDRGEALPAIALGDRVAWIVIEGDVMQDAKVRGPGALIYPEALIADRPLPDKDSLAVALVGVRALAFRADDFIELCDDDPDLGEVLLEALAAEVAAKSPERNARTVAEPADEPDEPDEPDERDRTEPERPPPPLRAETAPLRPPPSTPAVPVERSPLVQTLIVPRAERAAAEAQVEHALAKIAGEPEDDDAEMVVEVVADEPSDAERAAYEEGAVIEVEAAEPPARPAPVERSPTPRLGDHSEPEISIERGDDQDELVEPEPDDHLELTVTPADDDAVPVDVAAIVDSEDERNDISGPTITIALDEPSEPEIVIIQPGRPITANDANQVAGSIDGGTLDAPPPRAGARPRAKRQTDHD